MSHPELNEVAVKEPKNTFNSSGNRLVDFSGKRHLCATRRDRIRLSHQREFDVSISGPMTGKPDMNYPAFEAAANSLRALGLKVWSPTENGLPVDAPYEDHMRIDLSMLPRCAGVALLPGWERSAGAVREVKDARAQGLFVRELSYWLALLATDQCNLEN